MQAYLELLWSVIIFLYFYVPCGLVKTPSDTTHQIFVARGKFGFSTERMRRIFRENWSFFFRYQRSIHKEFLFADRFDGEPECKYYESDRSCRGY